MDTIEEFIISSDQIHEDTTEVFTIDQDAALQDKRWKWAGRRESCRWQKMVRLILERSIDSVIELMLLANFEETFESECKLFRVRDIVCC